MEQILTAIIDQYPADKGALRAQNSWIALFNTNEGEFKEKAMSSFPNFVNMPRYAHPEQLASLRENMAQRLIITSTTAGYHPRALSGKVIHHYQGQVAIPFSIPLEEIPVLQGERAYKVVGNPNGLLYLRALVNDKYAKPSYLLDRLSIFAKREPKDIYFWTSTKDSRESKPVKAIGFLNSGNNFSVNDLWVDDPVGVGLAYGMKIPTKTIHLGN